MDDKKYRYKKIAYLVVGILLVVAALLFFGLWLATKQFTNNRYLVVAIAFVALIVPYYFIASYERYELDNSYKEIVLEDFFKIHNFEFHSKQKGIKKYIYEISYQEFEALNFIKDSKISDFEKNNLVVGTIRDVEFRSEDYICYNDRGSIFNNGRIYVLNLREDKDFKLYITKEKRNDHLTSFDVKNSKYNYYASNVDKAKKVMILDKLLFSLERFESFGKPTIIVNNGCLYLILEGIKDSFSLTACKAYFDMVEQVDLEITKINHLIDSFVFKPKVTVKQVKMK